MIDWRKFISSVIGILIVSVVARADMVSKPDMYIHRRVFSPVRGQTQVQQKHLSDPYDTLSVSYLDVWFVQIPVETDVNIHEVPKRPCSLELVNGPSSCSLCLCALLGLGLYAAPQWIKTLSFGYLPEWYHNGALSKSATVLPFRRILSAPRRFAALFSRFGRRSVSYANIALRSFCPFGENHNSHPR